jgi:hypothetical protein
MPFVCGFCYEKIRFFSQLIFNYFFKEIFANMHFGKFCLYFVSIDCLFHIITWTGKFCRETLFINC